MITTYLDPDNPIPTYAVRDQPNAWIGRNIRPGQTPGGMMERGCSVALRKRKMEKHREVIEAANAVLENREAVV